MRDRTARLALLHPVALGALVVLVVNDQWAKQHVPSVVTGKASDLAGLVVAPLVLATLVELATGGRWPAARVLTVAVAVVGVSFTLVQLATWAADGWRHGLGWVQWPVRWLLDSSAVPRPVRHTSDPTDLLALPALVVPPLLHRRVVAGAVTADTDAAPTGTPA